MFFLFTINYNPLIRMQNMPFQRFHPIDHSLSSVASFERLLITQIAAAGNWLWKSSIVDPMVCSSLYAGNMTAMSAPRFIKWRVIYTFRS